jgi:hypothetical protein
VSNAENSCSPFSVSDTDEILRSILSIFAKDYQETEFIDRTFEPISRSPYGSQKRAAAA